MRDQGTSRVALAMVTLLLMPAPAAIAQGPSPSAPATSPAPEATGIGTVSTPGDELLALFPTEIAGRPVEGEPIVVVGLDHVADLDPDDENDARQLAQIEALLEAADATILDVTSASVLVELEGDEFALVGAYRIEGSDATATLAAYTAAFALEVDRPVIESAEIGGRDVRQVSSASSPEDEPFVFFASDDVTWIVVAPESVREDIVASLP